MVVGVRLQDRWYEELTRRDLECNPSALEARAGSEIDKVAASDIGSDGGSGSDLGKRGGQDVGDLNWTMGREVRMKDCCDNPSNPPIVPICIP